MKNIRGAVQHPGRLSRKTPPGEGEDNLQPQRAQPPKDHFVALYQ